MERPTISDKSDVATPIDWRTTDPLFHTPGLRRRIELHPSPGVISVGLEDDLHRFVLRLAHDQGMVTGVESRAERIPWSTCTAAGAFLAEQAVGRPLDALARLDAHSHCTHLFELVILAAAHAGDREPTRFDLWVADRQADRTRALLAVNGRVVEHWDMSGTFIERPDDWAGRDLRQFSAWKRELAPAKAERAMLMRRAVHISGGRSPSLSTPARAADRGPERMGACFTYQMPRALEAYAAPGWRRDFTGSGTEPLQDFDPHWH